MQNVDKAKVMKAMKLLDQAGAVYKIWTDEDVRDVARNLVEVLGIDITREDALVYHTDVTVLADATEQDITHIAHAILDAVKEVQYNSLLGTEVPC